MMLTLVLNTLLCVMRFLFLKQSPVVPRLPCVYWRETQIRLFNCCYVCWLVALAFELRHSANTPSLLKIAKRICIEQLCYSLAKLQDRQLV